MRVAVVSAVPVFPNNEGNRVRVLNMCRAIRQAGHDLFFVFIPSGSNGDADLAAHEREFGRDRLVRIAFGEPQLIAYRLKRARHSLLRKAFTATGGDRAFYNGLDEFYNAAASSQLAALHKRLEFDAVMCEYVYHSAALDAFPRGVLKILDAHDSFSDRHRIFAGKDYLYSIPEGEQVRGFRRADAVIAIQDEEAELFRRQLSAGRPEIHVVGHLLDVSRRVTGFSSSDAVFIGSGNIANVDAVNYFLDEIMPRVKNVLPSFRLALAGNICQRVPDTPDVVKLGIVDSIFDAFARAQVAVNPMRQGTGMNIKLLEAMAAGIPTVTTGIGARGLGERYREGGVEVPDGDPEAFAREVVRLCSSEEERRATGGAAFAAAQDWNDVQHRSLAAVFAGGGKVH